MSSPSPGRAYVGIAAPNVLTVPIDDTTGLVDLTAATGVNLIVVRSDGTTPTPWATTILTQTRDATGTHLTCQHAYASGDCTVSGPYKITPELVFSGGTTNCSTRTLRVDQANNIR